MPSPGVELVVRAAAAATATTADTVNESPLLSIVEGQDVPAAAEVASHQRQQRRERCFLCGYGDELYNRLYAEDINMLYGIIRKHYGHVSNLDLGYMVSDYYMLHIYHTEGDLPELTPEMVQEHIEQFHSLNASFIIGELTRRQLELYNHLHDEIFSPDTEKKDRRAHTVALNGVVREIKQLMLLRPDQTNFYSPQVGIDLRKVADPLHIDPRYTRNTDTLDSEVPYGFD